MNYLETFSSYLKSQNPPLSPVSIKNYLTDIRQLIQWVEQRENGTFDPDMITQKVLRGYQEDRHIAAASIERHISSLKKFSSFLHKEGYANALLFLTQSKSFAHRSDPYHLRGFKNDLYVNNRSHLTTKNYIVDVQQFLAWFSQNDSGILNALSSTALETYAHQLRASGSYASATLQRKLSSLRKYLSWCEKKGYIHAQAVDYRLLRNGSINTKEYHDALSSLSETNAAEEKTVAYASFPPLRLLQKTIVMALFLFDHLVVFPIRAFLQFFQTLIWRLQGKPIFENQITDGITSGNRKRNFSFDINQKISNSLKKYQSYAIAGYLHYVLIAVVIFSLSFASYQAFLGKIKKGNAVFLPEQTSRFLSFKGKLTDVHGDPLTSPAAVRFSLYNQRVASGSAMVWQEVDTVSPDQNGIFGTTLGTNSRINEEVFSGNTALWIGITVGQGNELTPREQIPTIDYASNADTVQGLSPIISSNAGNKNVLLALNSSGNLVINDGSSTFQTPGGDLTLLGQTIVIGTNTGSDGNVVLQPDGFGTIDLRKPIQNTSNNNNIPTALGSVEVDDTFAILATSSGQSALTINQNGSGDLISAMTQGAAKFTLKNDGSGYFSGALGVGIENPPVSLGVNGNILLQNTGRQLFSYDPSVLQIGGGRIASESGNIVFGNGSGWKFSIGKASNNGATKFVTFADNGNVGIGTDVPTSLFQIEGALGTTLSQINQKGSGDILNLSQNGNTKFTFSNAGNLGIGTTSPASRLHIVDGQTNGSIATFVNNAGISGNKPVGITIQLGNNSDNPTADSHFINFARGDGTVIGSIQGNGAGALVAYNTTGLDFAEYFKKEDRFEPMYPGDLICHGDLDGMTRCSTEHENIIGVVSNQAGFVGGTEHEKDTSYVLVGLVGQLPVNLVPGTVLHASDPLTVSSIPGLATKAVSSGQIIGRVLSFGSTTTTVSVQPSYFDPAIVISADTGNLTIAQSIQTGSEDNKNVPSFNLLSSASEIVTRFGAFSDAVFANARAGFLLVKIASINTLTAVQAEIDTIQAGQIISPLVKAQHLQTDFISPLAKDSHIGVSLSDSSLSIHADAASASAVVAKIDNKGNATFAGTLEVQTASISGLLAASSFQATDATISGTIHTKKIIADEIVGPVYNSIRQKGAISETDTTSTTGSYPSDTRDTSKYINIATLSGQLAYVDNLHAKTAAFEEGLLSFGTTSLSDTAISGTLSVGSRLSIAGTSVNVLGADLELQPLRQGGVSIAGGTAYFDSDGNLTLSGNATVQGLLAVNYISPIPDKDLIIRLSDSPNHPPAGGSEFIIQNASSSAVLAVNQLGDLIASGAARFAGNLQAKEATISKLNFQLVAPALALSETEVAATGSAGVASMNPHRKEITIRNPIVTDRSLIYITPKADTQNIVLYLLRQVPGVSFTVGINTPVDSPIPFNWLIVN